MDGTCQEGKHLREKWEQQWRQGGWDCLKCEHEIPRYSAVCSYIKQIGRPVALLDVGCGDGLILRFCEREWLASYSGLDISQTALDRIKNLLPNDRLICSSLEDFTTNERFDVILFNEVLYYTTDPEAHLKKFRDYLKPGGLFLISMLKMSGWRSRTARNARSAWRLIRKSKWKNICEVLINDIPRKNSWRIALIQP